MSVGSLREEPRTARTDGVRYASNADESCRMFASDWLERLSHVRPWMPHVIFVPAIIVCVAIALGSRTPLQVTGLVLLGLLVWTATEYFIHRFLFHPPEWIEEDTRRICSELATDEAVIPALPTFRHKFYFLVHGVHHDYPNDSTRLVMPPSVSVPISTLFLLLFMWIGGDAGVPVFAGFIIGYLSYDTIHFAVHHWKAQQRVARYLKKRHFRHHYSDSSRDYGVSSPLWDVIMGTLGRSRR